MTRKEFETRWKILLKNNSDKYDSLRTYYRFYTKTPGTMIKYTDNGIMIHSWSRKKWITIPRKYIIKIY